MAKQWTFNPPTNVRFILGSHMNFKRGKPKSARAGCLLCKPWKVWGNRKQAKKIRDLRKMDL